MSSKYQVTVETTWKLRSQWPHKKSFIHNAEHCTFQIEENTAASAPPPPPSSKAHVRSTMIKLGLVTMRLEGWITWFQLNMNSARFFSRVLTPKIKKSHLQHVLKSSSSFKFSHLKMWCHCYICSLMAINIVPWGSLDPWIANLALKFLEKLGDNPC